MPEAAERALQWLSEGHWAVLAAGGFLVWRIARAGLATLFPERWSDLGRRRLLHGPVVRFGAGPSGWSRERDPCGIPERRAEKCGDRRDCLYDAGSASVGGDGAGGGD